VLERRELGDAARVRSSPRTGGDEAVDEGDGLVDGVLTGADGDHVGVVVLPGQLGGRDAPDERGADTAHLVGGDLLAVARSAEHDAQRLDPAAWSRTTAWAADAERGIVVERVVLDRPVVHDVVALPREVVLQLRGELETRMIGGDVDAHAPILGSARVPAAAREETI
jgi:hypothetical protein